MAESRVVLEMSWLAKNTGVGGTSELGLTDFVTETACLVLVSSQVVCWMVNTWSAGKIRWYECCRKKLGIYILLCGGIYASLCGGIYASLCGGICALLCSKIYALLCGGICALLCGKIYALLCGKIYALLCGKIYALL